MRKLLLFWLCVSQWAVAQDLEYARSVVKELCSDELAGRGYVDEGDAAAAYFIEEEFKQNDLYAWNYNYYQSFNFSVNTFPDAIELAVGGVRLKPGKDYLVEADSPKLKGKFELTYLNQLPKIAPSGRMLDSTANYNGLVVIADSLIAVLPPPIRTALLRGMRKAGADGLIRLTDTKLTWTVSKQQAPLAQLTVKRESWSNHAKEVEVNVKPEFEKRHRTQNVLAFVEGSDYPDKFIVFTAHYDHLGKMGDVVFRGANDNASGVAMLLSLAKHYATPEHQPKYSIAFVAFAGEELGLQGSFHYVQQPMFPLKDIKFLVNLDILGTGDEGITVVNGAVHETEFEALKGINEQKGYLKQVKKRGRAAISDHYPFSEAGVPCFYIYTMGGIQAYHDVYDVPETLPLTEFEDIFRLITDFTARL